MTDEPAMVGSFLPVSAVFPTLQTDIYTFKSILSQLSRTDTVFWCARLNLVMSENKDYTKGQQFGLDQFFLPEQKKAVNDYVRTWRNVREGQENLRSPIVFFRGQLLELLRWAVFYCCDQPTDGITYRDPHTREQFVKVALIASEIWGKRIKLSLDGGIEVARKNALASFRESLQATATAPELHRSLGRGWLFFKDLFPQYYNSFEGDFHSLTGITIEQYFCCLTALITKFLNPESCPIFNIKELREHNRYGDTFCKYLSLESQGIDELARSLWQDVSENINKYEDAPPHYYKPLREKPILRTNDDRGIILDPIFYHEKASIGPLFHILKSPGCNSNDAFNAFGQVFEQYALGILTRMFPPSNLLSNRLSKNVSALDIGGNDIEVDALLNDIFVLVIFEIKSSFVRDGNAVGNDYEVFLQSLQEKYSVSSNRQGRSKRKGVGQLAGVVASISARKWLGNNNELAQVELIYPVLVVHDALITGPVYGDFFFSEFKRHLQPDSIRVDEIMLKGDLKVAPPIVMSINTLEDLEASIEQFALRDLFADYHNNCRDRIVSLHDFIATSSRYRNAVYHGYHKDSLIAKAMEALDSCSEEVFGRRFKDS